MRDYGKIHSRFWQNETLRGVDSDAKVLALYLLSSPHTTMLGAFHLPVAYACEDLGWVPERFHKGFETLSEIGFAHYDKATKWVWIVRFLDWNRPENPNQWKSIVKLAESIPASVSFKEEVCGTVRKPFLNSPVPAPVPVLKEEQGEAPLDCPHDAIIAAYHEALPTLPRIRSWTDTRRANLRARWREESKRQSLDYWKRLFAHVAASDFLTGRAPGRDGRPPFLASLDWLVKPENFAKVIEGKYHEAEAQA